MERVWSFVENLLMKSEEIFMGLYDRVSLRD